MAKYHFFLKVMIKKILFISLLFSSITFATSKEEIANKIREIISNLPANTISGILIYNPLMQDTVFAMNESSIFSLPLRTNLRNDEGII